MPTQARIILPDGWQIAQRAPTLEKPRATFWLQQLTYISEHNMDHSEERPAWVDVAGPFIRRSSALDAWRQRATADQLGEVRIMLAD